MEEDVCGGHRHVHIIFVLFPFRSSDDIEKNSLYRGIYTSIPNASGHFPPVILGLCEMTHNFIILLVSCIVFLVAHVELVLQTYFLRPFAAQRAIHKWSITHNRL